MPFDPYFVPLELSIVSGSLLIDCSVSRLPKISAIFALKDLPEKWAHFVEINANWHKK
jgi:hypothetical protein